MASKSTIAEFYTGKCIFITGVTGFMGKVLVEKLLRSCGNLQTIYVLLRNKKNQNMKQRFEEILNNKVFDNLRSENPDQLKKLVPIQGDLTLPGLGISPRDHELLISNVSIVFHSGATVKFDEPLKSSVEVNVVGTRRVLEFCHKIHHLEALVHLSTAYSNCDKTEIEEVVYPSPIPPHKIIDAIEWLGEETLGSITPFLIQSKPNSYTYTKALAETLLAEERGQLPVAIVRPSIVTAAWREPYPGWVDNLNGPTGIIAATLKGVFSSMHCNRSCVADLIPVDIVINLVIAVAFYTALDKPSSANGGEIPVYNCTSGSLNRLTWGQLGDIGFPVIESHPALNILGYPSGNLHDSVFINWTKIIFYNIIPACIIDLGLFLMHRKPRFVKIYKQLLRAEATLHFFTTHQWTFHTNNVILLYEKLSELDKKIFNFDIREMDWNQYINNYILGARQYVLKDDLQTVPLARKYVQRIYLFTKLAQIGSILIIWRVLLHKSALARQIWRLISVLILRLLRLLLTWS